MQIEKDKENEDKAVNGETDDVEVEWVILYSRYSMYVAGNSNIINYSLLRN